jgi:hypothetical protein
MLFGNGFVVLKKQVGVRVDYLVWDAYRKVCLREELRPNVGVEGFLRAVLEDGSVLRVLRLLQRAVAARAESLDDYANVLLTWYERGERWVYSGDRQISLDSMLLSVLRNISDPQLRSKIRTVLTAKQEDVKGEDDQEESGGKEREKQFFEDMPSSPHELVDYMAKKIIGLSLSDAEKREILERVLYIREHLRRGRK